jgi:hypothetical protein
MSGPEFADLRPIGPRGTYDPYTALTAYSYGGLNQGQIFPALSPNAPSYDCFREGETILFYLEVGFPKEQTGRDNPDGTYVSGLRIKPWWLRSNVEFRTPGDPAQSGNPTSLMGGMIPDPTNPTISSGTPCRSQIDTDVFGGWSVRDQPFNPLLQFDPVNTALYNAAGGRELGNRNVWYPSPKRLDTMPSNWGSAPLNIARPNTSDSILLDDVWFVPLPNPSTPPWDAAPWNIGAAPGGIPTNYRQNKVFTYPAFGRCLGVSFEVVLSYLADDTLVPYPAPTATPNWPVPPGAGGAGVAPSVRIGYRAGVTSAVVQERLG